MAGYAEWYAAFDHHRAQIHTEGTFLRRKLQEVLQETRSLAVPCRAKHALFVARTPDVLLLGVALFVVYGFLAELTTSNFSRDEFESWTEFHRSP